MYRDGSQRLFEGLFEILRFCKAAGHLGEQRECTFDLVRCDGRCRALRERFSIVRGVDHTTLPRIRRARKDAASALVSASDSS